MMYKYRPININTINMIVNSELFLAPAISFNDPFDSIYNVISDKLNSPQPSVGKNNHAINEATNQIDRKSIPFSGGICSFSRRHDQIQMWSHYAENHKGICFGFRTIHINNDNELIAVSSLSSTKNIGILMDGQRYLVVKNIIYSTARPSAVLESKLTSNHFLDHILTKQKNWEYEEECRIIEIESCKATFEKEFLSEVYLGMRMNKENRKLIVDLLKKYYIDQGIEIRIFSCTESKSELELKFESVQL